MPDDNRTTPPAIESGLRDLIKDELRGVYTATMVRIERVDESNRRATVSKKSDSDVIIENVPIASPFATDGGGLIAPLSREDEGLLIHTKEPLADQLVRHGEQPPSGERRFTLEAAVLLPMIWLDADDVPDHEDGEFQIALPGDGSAFRLFEDGSARLEHSSGRVIELDEDGRVTIGDPDDSSPVLTTDAVLEDQDGNEISIVDPGSSDVEAS